MSKQAITVGDTTCSPGERSFGKLLAGYLQDSAPVELWTTLINGAHKGPTLSIGQADQPAGRGSRLDL